jgi:hypothetical protein
MARNLLGRRIQELYDFGISNIWMSLTGDDNYHIASILSIPAKCFNRILEVAELINLRGIRADEFGCLGIMQIE